MPRIIDKERAEILQSTDEFIIDSAINGTRKVSFDTLKESLGTSGGSGDGSSANIEIDGALSSSSTNPVQNRVINAAIDQMLAAAKSYTDNKVGNKMDQVTLATVATTVTGIRDGVDIVRVHDVKENLQAAMVADKLYR